MTNAPSPKHVFMSYSRRDEAVMRRVAGYLRKQGINVWVDNENLVPGTPIWEVEIEKAIKGAGGVVVLLSPDSNTSPWVRREISYAEDNWIRIFPILIAGDERNAVPIRLTNHQRIDIRQNEEVGLNLLHTALLPSFEIQEVQEQWGKAEAAEIAARREEELEVARKVARHKAEQEKAIREKTELEASEKPKREKVEKKNFLFPWWGRMLLGGIVGIILWFIIYNTSVYDPGYYIFIFLIVCGFSGAITYPHYLSIVFLILGFCAGGLINGTNHLGYFILAGVVVGIPSSALLSRILHWIKVFK